MSVEKMPVEACSSDSREAVRFLGKLADLNCATASAVERVVEGKARTPEAWQGIYAVLDRKVFELSLTLVSIRAHSPRRD